AVRIATPDSRLHATHACAMRNNVCHARLTEPQTRTHQNVVSRCTTRSTLIGRPSESKRYHGPYVPFAVSMPIRLHVGLFRPHPTGGGTTRPQSGVTGCVNGTFTRKKARTPFGAVALTVSWPIPAERAVTRPFASTLA